MNRPTSTSTAIEVPPPPSAAEQQQSPHGDMSPDRVSRAEVLQICAMVTALRRGFTDPNVLCAATAFALYRDHPRWDVRLITPAPHPRKGSATAPRMIMSNVLTIVTETGSHILIDFEWRDHFSIQCRTNKYEEFYKTLSSVFVGTMVTLVRHLRHHGAQVEACFRAFAIPIPPWRTTDAMVSSFEFHVEHAIPVKFFCESLMTQETTRRASGDDLKTTSAISKAIASSQSSSSIKAEGRQPTEHIVPASEGIETPITTFVIPPAAVADRRLSNPQAPRVHFASSLTEHIRAKLLEEQGGGQVVLEGPSTTTAPNPASSSSSSSSSSAVPVTSSMESLTLPASATVGAVPEGIVGCCDRGHSSSHSHPDPVASEPGRRPSSLDERLSLADSDDSVEELVGRRATILHHIFEEQTTFTLDLFTEAAKAYATAATEPVAIPPPPGIEVYAAGSDVAQPFPETLRDPSTLPYSVPSSVLASYKDPPDCWPLRRSVPKPMPAAPVPVPMPRVTSDGDISPQPRRLTRTQAQNKPLPGTVPQSLQFNLLDQSPPSNTGSARADADFSSVSPPRYEPMTHFTPVDSSPHPFGQPPKASSPASLSSGSSHGSGLGVGAQPIFVPPPAATLASQILQQAQIQARAGVATSPPLVWGYVGQTPIEAPVLPINFLNTLSAHWAPTASQPEARADNNPPKLRPHSAATASPPPGPPQSSNSISPVYSNAREDESMFDKVSPTAVARNTEAGSVSLLSQMFSVGSGS